MPYFFFFPYCTVVVVYLPGWGYKDGGGTVAVAVAAAAAAAAAAVSHNAGTDVEVCTRIKVTQNLAAPFFSRYMANRRA